MSSTYPTTEHHCGGGSKKQQQQQQQQLHRWFLAVNTCCSGTRGIIIVIIRSGGTGRRRVCVRDGWKGRAEKGIPCAPPPTSLSSANKEQVDDDAADMHGKNRLSSSSSCTYAHTCMLVHTYTHRRNKTVLLVAARKKSLSLPVCCCCWSSGDDGSTAATSANGISTRQRSNVFDMDGPCSFESATNAGGGRRLFRRIARKHDYPPVQLSHSRCRVDGAKRLAWGTENSWSPKTTAAGTATSARATWRRRRRTQRRNSFPVRDVIACRGFKIFPWGKQTETVGARGTKGEKVARGGTQNGTDEPGTRSRRTVNKKNKHALNTDDALSHTFTPVTDDAKMPTERYGGVPVRSAVQSVDLWWRGGGSVVTAAAAL